MPDKFNERDFALLQSALDTLDKVIEKEAGEPSMAQIAVAAAKAEYDVEETKRIVEEMMAEELADAKNQRREIALLRAKLYQIEMQEDASDVIKEAKAVLSGGEA